MYRIIFKKLNKSGDLSNANENNSKQKLYEHGVTKTTTTTAAAIIAKTKE